MTGCMAAGEILPQALCKSYALVIGAHTAWLVKFLMWACGIVSWPISKLLDWLLGSEHTVRPAFIATAAPVNQPTALQVEMALWHTCQDLRTRLCGMSEAEQSHAVTMQGLDVRGMMWSSCLDDFVGCLCKFHEVSCMQLEEHLNGN